MKSCVNLPSSSPEISKTIFSGTVTIGIWILPKSKGF